MKILVLATLCLVLAGCGNEGGHSSSPHADAAQIDSDCRVGRRQGAPCEVAQKALSEKEHRDAQSAFRSMGKKH